MNLDQLEPDKVFKIGERVLVIIRSDQESVNGVKALAEETRSQVGNNVTFVILVGTAEIDALGEQAMAQLGWVPAGPEPEHETGIDPAQL